MNKLMNYSEGDVNLQLAIRAHNGTSMFPERRGQSYVTDYMAHMKSIEEKFAQWVTDENQEGMIEGLEYYRCAYLDLLNAYLHAHSRVVSQFITGAGGWTGRMVRSNQKKIDTADKRLNEWIEKCKKIEHRLRNQYDPHMIDRQPIKSGDADATLRLQEKIEKAEALQEHMKEANKIVRKKSTSDEEKIDELMGIGLSEALAASLLRPDYMGRYGYANYQLANNNANIRRMKQRLEELEAVKNTEHEESVVTLSNGDEVSIIRDPEEYRIRLVFDGKPSADVRSVLKSNGFKWSPRNSAWQRHLNGNGEFAVKQVLQALRAK